MDNVGRTPVILYADYSPELESDRLRLGGAATLRGRAEVGRGDAGAPELHPGGAARGAGIRVVCTAGLQ